MPIHMAKHIGIVAASGDGPILCYRTICEEGAALLGPHTHPEVTMHTYPVADYLRHIEAGRWDDVADVLLSSAEKLRRAGADLLVCPVNTLHQAVDIVRDRSPLPWLHIAEEVAGAAVERGFGRLAILGTRYLMEGPVYGSKLGPKGIEHEIPDGETRERINALIFDELVRGRFEAPTRAYFMGLIGEARDRGCDAAVLGCTELPLLLDGSDSPLPTLDSTRILARAALREALRE